MKQIIQTAFLAFALAAGPARAAVDIAGNWSDITFSSVGASGYSLSFQESGGNYSCFIDDYDLDFISYQASQVTFYPNTLHFHLDWAPPGGFSFDGFLSADGSTLNCVLSNSFGFFPQTVTREPSVANFLPAIFTNAGGSLPYRLFVPPQYQETNQYPLMLFLHGAGEAGVDNVIQLTDLIGELSFISVSNQLAHPCFYVAPQCPTNGTWVDATRRGQLPGLLAALEMQYHIDTNRIYVTGLSLGGFGAWDQITQNPSLYAAAVPLSGGGDPSLAPLITSVPVWNFHSANDSVVNVLFSREMITAVRLAGGNPIYTEYATGDHPIWSIGYYTPGLVDWVFAQKRGQPLNGFLQTTFTSPTTGATNVTLAGVCGDASAAVSGLNAYNVQTAAFSTVTGATNWTAPNIPLQPDATNRIVVTAVGTSWSAILGGSTSFNNSLLVTQVAAPIELTIARNRGSLLLSWSGGVPPTSSSSGSA